jgi:hypothetical protein
MKPITVQEIMELGPCDDYTEERVKELWAGRTGLTGEEIRDLDIPIEDRGWAILSVLAKRHPWRARKLSRRIALDVAHIWDSPNIVWYYLVTGDESACDAAWAAARDAARADAWAAAWAAARDAARADAWADAWAAACDAASDAASDAARAAACDAACDAARAAARAAACDAARAAARAAAWDAAWDAFCDAAYDAAYYAARDAAWGKYIDWALDVMGDVR